MKRRVRTGLMPRARGCPERGLADGGRSRVAGQTGQALVCEHSRPGASVRRCRRWAVGGRRRAGRAKEAAKRGPLSRKDGAARSQVSRRDHVERALEDGANEL